MEKIIIAIFSTLPVIYWWRFRKTPLDRDYCPYAYPAWRHTGYLTSGHIDIKPPLIQWLYKVWLFLMPKRIPLLYSLRLMPLAGHCATVALLGIYGGWQASLIAGLLYANPYMWPHMANTEWLGALFLALALVLPEPYKQLALGVMWLANLKFIPLGLAIGGIMAWKEAGNCFGLLIIAWQALPFALATLYLTATGRLSAFWKFVVVMPRHFGKVRRLLSHTDIPLIKKSIGIELLPFIACMDWGSEWSWLSVLWVGLCVASKQVVPHHLILLIPLLALAGHLTPMVLVAYMLTLCFRNLILWRKPEWIYRATFGDPIRGTDYGMMLKDSDAIVRWILSETKPEETIFVNGIDNEIYTNTGRKAWFLTLPEYWELPTDSIPPRVIVHCAMANKATTWWYESQEAMQRWGWKLELVSPLGLFSVLTRKPWPIDKKKEWFALIEKARKEQE